MKYAGKEPGRVCGTIRIIGRSGNIRYYDTIIKPQSLPFQVRKQSPTDGPLAPHLPATHGRVRPSSVHTLAELPGKARSGQQQAFQGRQNLALEPKPYAHSALTQQDPV